MNDSDVNMFATSKTIMYTILLKYGSKAMYRTFSPEPILLESSINKTLTLQLLLSVNRKLKDHDRIDL